MVKFNLDIRKIHIKQNILCFKSVFTQRISKRFHKEQCYCFLLAKSECHFHQVSIFSLVQHSLKPIELVYQNKL